MLATIASDVQARFCGVTIPGDVEHDAEQHALFLADDEGPAQVISINLDSYGLKPSAEDTVFIKDWSEMSGLTDSLVQAGVVEVLGEVHVGPFRSRAYEVRVVATKAGA